MKISPVLFSLNSSLGRLKLTPDTQSAVCVEDVSGEKRIAPTCEHLFEKSISPLTIQLSEKNIKTSVPAIADVIIKPKCSNGTNWKRGRGQEKGETHSFVVRKGWVCGWAPALNTLVFTFQTPSIGNSKILSRQIMQHSSKEAINKAEESQRLQIDSKKYI